MRLAKERLDTAFDKYFKRATREGGIKTVVRWIALLKSFSNITLDEDVVGFPVELNHGQHICFRISHISG